MKKEIEGVVCLRQGAQGKLVNAAGEVVVPPLGWQFLKAGDAGLTRRVRAMGLIWRVEQQMGRRVISRGIWAPREHIESARQAIEAQRATPTYQRKMTLAKERREKKQETYVGDFHSAVIAYLQFHPRYADLAEKIALLVTEHATPVGSGTVARTQRIPIAQRAEKAVIAWMRHHTTAYDEMQIAHVKGERRRVRKLLAEQSVRVLYRYRQGADVLDHCLLRFL